jgi:hypothetical protein
MSDIGFVFVAGAALAVITVSHLAERQRGVSVREMATRCGFHYIGEALPRSLTLHGTPFERASKVWNVVDGEPRGVRVIAFDCRVGVGKHSWRRTVVAMGRDAEFSKAVGFNPEMTLESVGAWKFLYRPRASFGFRISGLMPVEELEACLNSVSSAATMT